MSTALDSRPTAALRNAIANWVGLLQRAGGALLAALGDSRERQAAREVARYVGWGDGRMTDNIEREIMRRLCTSEWSRRE